MKKSKLLLSAMLLGLTATANAQVTLYGNVINGYDTQTTISYGGQTFTVNMEWGVERTGIHKFDISANGAVEQNMLVTNAMQLEYASQQGWTIGDYNLGWYDENGKYTTPWGSHIYGHCGAVLKDGVYYTFNESEGDDFGQADNNVFTSIKMRKWDAASYLANPTSPLLWKQIGTTETLSAESGFAFTDMTYDYEDDEVYAVQVVVSDDSPAVPYLLVKVDLDNMTTTPVSTRMLDEEIRAIAAHPNGNLYGIGVSGMLYIIDKETAEMTKVGLLHKNQHRTEGAVIDWRTGKMYWTCNEFDEIKSENGVAPTQEQVFQNKVTALYEVDVETATETKLFNPEMREVIGGLFFVDDYVKADNDLNVKWVSTPLQLMVNEPAQFTVKVKNMGTKQANSFSVELYVNGEMVKKQNGSPLKAGADKEITITYVPEITVGESADVYVKVVSAKDEKPENNQTAVKTIKVLQADMPTVTINGSEIDGKMNISWAVPSTGEKTEDFERYAPFIIDNVGSWTMQDLDGAYMPSWNSFDGEYTWPNCHAPQSFIVFNPTEAGLPADYIEDATSTYYCNSGSQMLMAQIGGFPAQSEGGNPTLVDGNNWLISPELSGDAQDISFFAKSWTSQYADDFGVIYNSEEQFNVLYSLTDNAVESFEMLEDGEGLVAPAYFADGEYYFSLPEGTKYFAIQHVTPWTPDEYGEYNRMTAFFLDDITYTPAVGNIIGYNVYRNGVKLTSTPITNLRYSVSLVHGTNEICVTVVYENGESAPSNVLVAEYDGGDVTAINAMQIDNSRMNVFTTAGQYVGNRLPAQKGTYVVRTAGKTQKVVVK